MSTIFERLWKAFRDKEYRQIYAESFSDSKIATQIKVLREQRGWTQQQLAEAAGMKQSRIAALEYVNYSSWSIRTLRRLAQAFDLWLDVEFKEFGTVWPQLRDLNRESLTRRPFEEDPAFQEHAGRRTRSSILEKLAQGESSSNTWGSRISRRLDTSNYDMHIEATLGRKSPEHPSAIQRALNEGRQQQSSLPYGHIGVLSALK